MKKGVFIISLGCAKNQVDSEFLLGEFMQAGYTAVSHISSAHVIVVNTCGFIGPAKKESVNEILNTVSSKSPVQKLLVTGCLAQRYTSELRKEIPEVDGFLGVYRPGKLLQILDPKKASNKQVIEAPGQRVFLEGPAHCAYLKISEGCNRRCGFCAIPSIRGRLASRKIADLVSEALSLQERGVKELTLIAQDLTSFGRDLGLTNGLVKLVKALLADTKIPWLRLMYGHPGGVELPLLELLATEDRLCRYLDLPIQHASTRMLKLMRRGYTESRLRKTISQIRSLVPDITLRTTVLVGHPGETAKDFETLMAFVEKFRFDRLGGFIYSKETGTWSHDRLKAAKVSSRVAQRRLDKLMARQQLISSELNQGKIGRTLPVIIDEKVSGRAPYSCMGRTRGDAPEIDNSVMIKGRGAAPGDIRNVKITDAWEFDLEGRLV